MRKNKEEAGGGWRRLEEAGGGGGMETEKQKNKAMWEIISSCHCAGITMYRRYEITGFFLAPTEWLDGRAGLILGTQQGIQRPICGS